MTSPARAPKTASLLSRLGLGLLWFLTPLAPATAASLRHGDSVTIPTPIPSPQVSRSFLGGAGGRIESGAVGAAPQNGGGWTFNDLGGPTTVRTDLTRGAVLFTPMDAQNYNATRRYDPGFSILPQRHVYKAHYVRNVLLLDGLPYTKSYQWKHERISWQNSVSDTQCEFKVHNWPTSMGPITLLNRTDASAETWWGGVAADSNGGWALMEIFIYTGSDGGNDGRVVTRVHKNGSTRVGQNRSNMRIYSGPERRLRYFVEQNYFGNFGQIEDGVDNSLPKPQIREIHSDDSQVQIGGDNQAGWQRIELRDSVDLRDAQVRELQDWQQWTSAGIALRLNTGGLPPGLHDLYLVVIDGLDADGWDIVSAAHPIQVRVDVPRLFGNGFENAPLP